MQGICIKANKSKSKEGKFEIRYEMGWDELQERLKFLDEKINGLEQSVKMCNDQLALLRQEREQIVSILQT